MKLEPRVFLRSLFDAALAAVDPLKCLPPYLPPPPIGRTIVIGAGKASARMARAVESAWDGPLSGLVVTRYGHGDACERIEVLEAGHPVPDDAGASAARQMLTLAKSAGPEDLVLALMSGGGSSLLTLPAPGLSVEDLRVVNVALLKSGAPIGDMNLVRRHLSSIKGGRLGQACGEATVCTLIISDVPGDDPSVVASGPTVVDLSRPNDALDVLRRWRIAVPPHVTSFLSEQAAEQRSALGPRQVHVIATADQALEAAADLARRHGVHVMNFGGNVEGEAREVARRHAAMALHLSLRRQAGAVAEYPELSRPHLILSGGETTVTVHGTGRGGRNAEYLLSLALTLDGAAGVHALACDTDGIDGIEVNAGGWVDPVSIRRARALGMDPRACLDNNDAYAFLNLLDDLVVTGPTRTNVNDFRAVLIC